MTVGFDSEVDELKHELANKQAVIQGWEHLWENKAEPWSKRVDDLEFRIADALAIIDTDFDSPLTLATTIRTILTGRVA